MKDEHKWLFPQCPGTKEETGVTSLVKGGYKKGTYAMIGCCLRGNHKMFRFDKKCDFDYEKEK